MIFEYTELDYKSSLQRQNLFTDKFGLMVSIPERAVSLLGTKENHQLLRA